MNGLRQLWRLCSRIPLPWLLIAGWTVILVIAAGAAWVSCPAWLTGGESASETLRNLGLLLAAAIGLPIAIWRSTVAERQADAARRQSDTAGQMLLNDRFQKGAEMLGHAEIESVRIGGIYALSRLAREYPESFHIPVMQLLSTFVVDRTREETPEHVAPPEDSETPGTEAQGEPDASDAEKEEEATGQDKAKQFESALAERYGPLLAADWKVGPVSEPANDVAAVMGQIAQRSERQIALEIEEKFRINLAEARLPGLSFHEANFSNVDFTKADLRRLRVWMPASFANAVLPGADFSAARLIGADFRNADMRRVNLTAARLLDADFRNAEFSPIDLTSQNIWKGAWFEAKLVGAQLDGADLREVELAGADMRGASLAGAKLDAASLGDNLSGADLRAASLRGAKLSGVDLSNANLAGAGADLNGAELTNANLSGAILGNADLTDANLADAVLSGTDFCHDWMLDRTIASPARGLTQRQLDQAKADPASPPILEGVMDPETNKPLVWNGQVV